MLASVGCFHLHVPTDSFTLICDCQIGHIFIISTLLICIICFSGATVASATLTS